MIDLLLFESGDGGDVNLLGNDIEMTNSIFNMVYMALFGGNPEAVTTGNEVEGEERNDFWGNALLLPNDQEKQLNSFTENVLNTVALDSAGRVKIEDAAKDDLQFMSILAEITIDVSIVMNNRVEIEILLIEPGNLTEKKFQFIWDGTRQELIEKRIL
jgi:hypothetical protein